MDTKTFALHLKWRRSSPYNYFHIQIQTRKLFIISQPSSLWSALYSKLGTPSSCLELNHKAYSSLTTCTWKQRPIPWGKSVSHPSTYSIKCACSGKSHMEGSINYLLATPLEDDNEDPLYLCFNLHCTILESLWEFSTSRANESNPIDLFIAPDLVCTTIYDTPPIPPTIEQSLLRWANPRSSSFTIYRFLR